MANTQLGKVCLTPKGAFSETMEYEVLDVVRYDGATFIVKQPCKGVTPAEGDYYMLIVEDGTGGGGSGGADGEDGGYYIPSVDNGVLRWTPSKADMPAVESSVILSEDVIGKIVDDVLSAIPNASGVPF